jgi:flagellar protein FlaG
MSEIESQALTMQNLSSLHTATDKIEFEPNVSKKDMESEQQKGNLQTSSSKEPDSELISEVKENLEKLNRFIPVTSTNLSFEFDDKGNPPFIRVIDKDNDEVIREIPSKEFREVAKALDEFADKLSNKGFIFDKTV